jgi:hypothetical protein
MNRFQTIQTIEQQLERADRRRRLARFLRHLGIWAACVATAMIALGALLSSGLLPSTLAASLLHVLLGVLALFSLTILLLFDWGKPAPRDDLAAAIERSHQTLYDRLNTLAHLKSSPVDSPLVDAISAQTAQVLKATPPPPAYSFRRAWMGLATGLAMCACLFWFYSKFQPWQRLRAAELAAAERRQQQQQQPLVLPEQAAAGQADETWGEVRVSEPGRDVRAAEFDVLPLQIEAAASDPLVRVDWFAAVNGKEHLAHDLPAPEDPTVAVYRDELALSDLAVRDWDVVSYYAQATTSTGKVYRSELYFVDVFPLREELASTPGGTQGPAYRLLQHATALVERQQGIVRQQFRAEQMPADQAHQRSQMRESLALEEKALAQDTRRVAAQAQAEWPADERVADWTKQLDLAAETIEKASEALRAAPEGQSPAEPQQALRDLIAARKALQDLLRNHPESFQAPPQIAQPSAPPADGTDPDQLAAAQQRAGELADQQQTSDLQQQVARTMQELEDIEKNPEQYSPEQMQQQAQQSGELLQRAEQLAQQNPAQSQRLSKTLEEPNRSRLQSACDKLGNCRSSGEKSQAASAARSGLSQVASALSADQAQHSADQLHSAISRQLAGMHRQQQDLQAARDAVKKMLGDQRRLQRDANGANARNGQQPQMAERQQKLLERFEQAQQQHPTAFSGLDQQVGQTDDAMRGAAQTLRNQPGQGRAAAERAGDQLQQLDSALEEKQQLQQLVDRFQLQRLMQEQMRQLQHMSQSPDDFAVENYPRTADDARQLGDRGTQLGASAASQATAPPSWTARQQRQQKQQDQIQQSADQLAQAADPPARGRAADQLRLALRPLAEQLRPEMPSGLRPNDDNLQESGHQALASAMRQLESLSSRRQGRRPLTQEQQRRLRADAAANFAEGIPSVYGHNQRSEQVVDRIRRDLTEQVEPVDLQKVRELVSQIQQLQREVAVDSEPRNQDTELTNVDPSRYPPAYRRAIERYFQALSEQK